MSLGPPIDEPTPHEHGAGYLAASETLTLEASSPVWLGHLVMEAVRTVSLVVIAVALVIIA